MIMTIEKTCGNCENVKFNNNNGWGVFGCKKTGFVIPHQANFIEGVVIFTRIPSCCPSKGNFYKSKEPADKKDFVIKTFKDFD